jgi:hypothetical protein
MRNIPSSNTAKDEVACCGRQQSDLELRSCYPHFPFTGVRAPLVVFPDCDVGLSHLRSVETAPHLGDDCDILFLRITRPKCLLAS